MRKKLYSRLKAYQEHEKEFKYGPFEFLFLCPFLDDYCNYLTGILTLTYQLS